MSANANILESISAIASRFGWGSTIDSSLRFVSFRRTNAALDITLNADGSLVSGTAWIGSAGHRISETFDLIEHLTLDAPWAKLEERAEEIAAEVSKSA